MRPARVAASLVAIPVLVAGCVAAPAVAPSPSASETSRATAAAPATPAGPATATFGRTHPWPDGLSVTVQPPTPFIPSTWVRTVNSFDRFWSVEVTVRNGTGKRFDLSRFAADGQASGKAADPTYDPGKLGPLPPRSVAKGGAAVFRLGFGVAKRKGFTLLVTPGLEYTPVVFSAAR